jgi:hypothetical protein
MGALTGRKLDDRAAQNNQFASAAVDEAGCVQDRLTLAEKGYHTPALPMGEFIKAAGA